MATRYARVNASNTAVVDLISPVLSRLAELAPRPVSLEATGLTPEMLADLVLKQLLRGGSQTSAVLGERLGLVGPVLEPIVQFLRQEGRLQLQARASFDNMLPDTSKRIPILIGASSPEKYSTPCLTLSSKTSKCSRPRPVTGRS